MKKELSGSERRKILLDLILQSEKPVSGTELGRQVGVSRQIIVRDIAFLRSEGHLIIPTARGYISETKPRAVRLFKVRHTDAQLEEELTTVVDLGGMIKDVMVNHRVYGKMSAKLNVRNRRDIGLFMEDIRSGKSVPLLNVTSGYHYHHIEADSETILDEIAHALEEKGMLAKRLPYEEQT